ncbi:hypothetical protein [Archaeoglobus sulfaticallidus]|nr:hypothetical protein [Archaeoglobus sulfaticallidus]
MGWSWHELCETPESVYLDVLRIIGLKNKEEIRVRNEQTSGKR